MKDLMTIARPYARAAFEFACHEHQFAEWLDWFQNMRLILSYSQIRFFLKDPNVTAAQQLSFFISVLKESMGGHVKNFLHLLILNRRMMILPEIDNIFVQLYNEFQKQEDVFITSAYPLTEDQKMRVIATLEKKFSKKIILHDKVDESILGGAIIRMGSQVLNASGQEKLNGLYNALRGAY